VVAVALLTFRRRPLGNALILAGVAVAALGSGLAGTGVAETAVFIAAAAVLLYLGFVAPTGAETGILPRWRRQRQSGSRGAENASSG
jgi:hypothetical protein